MGRTLTYSTNVKSTLVDFLANKFVYLNAEQWCAHIAKGYLLINKTVMLDPQYALKHGDEIMFDPPRELEPAVDETIDILHEDDAVLVVSKSGNMPVAEGGRYCKNTLVHLGGLRLAAKKAASDSGKSEAEIEEASLKPVQLFPVHRLDKETSGVVVLAKNAVAANALARQFAAKSENASKEGGSATASAVKDKGSAAVEAAAEEVGKVYHTVLLGEMAITDEPVEVKCRIGLAAEAQEGGVPKKRVDGDLSKIRKACFAEESSLGKPALTYVKPLIARGGLTFAEVRIVTGRTHQIRLHCASLGYPLVGDKLYGSDPVSDELYLKRARGEVDVEVSGLGKVDRQLLHASSLTIAHPTSCEKVTYSSDARAVFLREVPSLRGTLF